MSEFSQLRLGRELEESKRTIAQLKQQLAATEQLLQQERVAREYAERAAQQAANAAEVAARAAVEASRHHSMPAPVVVQSDKLFTRTESGDCEMEDVSDPQPRSRDHVVTVASAPMP
ncbi:hypothetical protein PF002_g17164 [Phytophthora fragariae]|uniref:Uncharacterized protein n=1 Tax=Phytophthora fragariae TaxID=53985 RepID=A0A6A3YC65_9STRA|nr:hypothetical protein PF003_g26939 [Phytophthora fragariae]KAE9216112.1 hypothetical protein PF002_g17164 [Phytophthora fragariae]KAE9300197.1 hypothetical protein PF001_g15070 [Phytophthora fragariae]